MTRKGLDGRTSAQQAAAWFVLANAIALSMINMWSFDPSDTRRAPPLQSAMLERRMASWSDTTPPIKGEVLMHGLEQPDVWRIGSDEEYFRYRPPLEAFDPASIQVEHLLIYFGGFDRVLDTVNRQIQILNIATDRWETPVPIPKGLAETHQGLAFDKKSRYVYAISGQTGGGCGPATTKSFRFHVDTRVVQKIPPLPAGRYNPGVAVVNETLHVFGGASEKRNMSGLDHWALDIGVWLPDQPPGLNSSRWRHVADLPVSGCHGESFSVGNFLYHLGGCSMEHGLFGRMRFCHPRAHANGMYVHHVPVPASAYRFNLRQHRGAVWEKIADMPHAVCISTALIVGSFAVFFGGAGAELQGKRGSPPRSQNVVQALDLRSLRWTVLAPLPAAETRPLFHCSAWQAPHAASHSFHMIRSAEYHLPNRTVERSTYLVADLSRLLPPGHDAAKASHKREELARAASHPKDWSSFEVVEEGFLRCMSQRAAAVSAVTRRNGPAGYNAARISRNIAHHRLQFPVAVVYPKTPKETAAVVKCAVGSGLQVCARGGKHSFEGLSCTHGVVIDVTRMRSFDTLGGGQARLGAGLSLGQVLHAALRHRVLLPAGVCATVGVSGLALVGGQGFLSRLHGLLADRVVGLEVVTAEGTVVMATAEQHADLLWLGKGGGGYEHFPGIVTALVFRTEKLKPEVKQWVKFEAEVQNPTSQALKTFMHWQGWAPNHKDRRLTTELWVSKQWDGKARLFYSGLFVGPVHEFEAIWRDQVEKKVPSTLRYSALTASEYALKSTGLTNEKQLLTGKDGWDASGARWKGRSFVSNGPMTDAAAFIALANTVWRAPGRQYIELKPLGGAVRDIAPADTAFWHRKAAWWGLYQSFWSADTAATDKEAMLAAGGAAVRELVRAMREQGVYGGQYAGYVDHEGARNRGEELRNYYGGNLPRIQHVRRKWDPSGVFRHVRPKVDLPAGPRSAFASRPWPLNQTIRR